MAPRYGFGYRPPFGHRHAEQEEVYVVVSRGMEGGPEGAEILAFGAPNTDNKDAEMQQGWWADSA